MASTYSTSLRLELMATGDQSGTWGDTTNTNLGTLLEQSITGYLSKAMADTNQTLSSLNGASDEARNAVVEVTGALTGTKNVIVPTAEKLYLFKNSTTGGFAVTIKTTAGTGVAVAMNNSRWVYCDGTNVVDGMSGPLTPTTSDSASLGTAALMWSDLFLASGGVINWNAGDVTVTHSANALAFAGASSGYSFDALVETTGSSAGFVGYRTTSTEAGAAAGPIVDLYRNSATPAVNDILGQLLFNGEDSAGNTQEYAAIEAVIADPTTTAEDGALDFYATTAGTRTRVMSVGPNLDLAAIGQIKFPATQNPSSDVNTLDDYEEGTYVPVLSFNSASVGITYSLQSGRYVKIGKLVVLDIDLVLTSKGSSGGAAAISLPFTSATAAGTASSGIVGLSAGFSSLVGGIVGYVSSASTTVQLRTPNSTGSASVTDSNFGDTSEMHLTLSYQAAS